jgi:predicted nucleotidyltransferase
MINFIDPQPSLVVLYGSWGRGRRRPLRDDVDLLVVVDWPFHPRPEPFTPETDAGMLYGRRQLILAAALPPPIRRCYWDMMLSTDILVLTSSEVATWREADETWLGEEVRAAFEPGEQRIIFKDGELQKRWRDYSLSTNPDPKRPYEEWSDFAKAKINGYHFLDQVLKAQKNAPDHDRSGAHGTNRG